MLASACERGLLKNENVFPGAHVPQDLGPDAHGNLAQMCFPEQEHQGARLSDASTDTERNFIFQNRLVIRKLQKINLVRQFELLAQGFGIDADALLRK